MEKTVRIEFELPTEEDELEELRNVGINLQEPNPESALLAEASELLRRQMYYAEEMEKLAQRRDAELELVTVRYENQIKRLKSRHDFINQLAIIIAQNVTYSGKTKSHRLGFGTIGHRSAKEKIKITDQAKAVAFAEKNYPGTVKATYSVKHAEIAPHILKLHKEDKLPEGFEYQPNTETYYATPVTREELGHAE